MTGTDPGLAGQPALWLLWRLYRKPYVEVELREQRLALEARDMPKFFNYVNLKEIFNNIVEAADHDLKAPGKLPPDDWTGLSRSLGRKFAHLFLPKLFDSFEPQIRNVVERYLLNLKQSQILGIAAAVTVARIDTRGDEAQVTLTDPKTHEALHFQMRRQPNHGVWQIVSVNYQDLKRFYKREFQH